LARPARHLAALAFPPSRTAAHPSNRYLPQYHFLSPFLSAEIPLTIVRQSVKRFSPICVPSLTRIDIHALLETECIVLLFFWFLIFFCFCPYSLVSVLARRAEKCMILGSSPTIQGSPHQSSCNLPPRRWLGPFFPP
jgi:hypothetical protein